MQTWKSQASHLIHTSSCLRYSYYPYRGLFLSPRNTWWQLLRSLPARRPGPFLFLPCRVDTINLTPGHLLRKPWWCGRKMQEKAKLYLCLDPFSPLVTQHRSHWSNLNSSIFCRIAICEVYSDSQTRVSVSTTITRQMFISCL